MITTGFIFTFNLIVYFNARLNAANSLATYKRWDEQIRISFLNETWPIHLIILHKPPLGVSVNRKLIQVHNVHLPLFGKKTETIKTPNSAAIRVGAEAILRYSIR